MTDEPNAALLMAFAGVPKEDTRRDKVVKERQETLDSMRALTGAIDREVKRLEGLEKARSRRNVKGSA